MRFRALGHLLVFSLFFATALPLAAETGLTSVLYPDRQMAILGFNATHRAPKAEVAGRVTMKDGVAEIELTYSNIEPAVLFGGDITAYVVWAVTPAGVVENLGGIANLEKSGRQIYSTARKDIATMITAEHMVTVREPGDLVVFISGPVELKGARSTPFMFTSFKNRSDIIKRERESIVGMTYKDKAPLALLQAKKAVELSDRVSASKYDAEAVQKAKTSLQTANTRLSKDWNDPKGLEAARTTLEYASQALTKWDAATAAAKAASAAAEKDALAGRAATAEQGLKQTQTDLSAAQKQADDLTRENSRLRSELDTLKQASAQERETLKRTAAQDHETSAQALAQESDALKRTTAELSGARAEMSRLSHENARLHSDSKRIAGQRDTLKKHMMGGLSALTTSAETERGYVVTLAGTAFGSGQSALTTDAKYVLAKLSGLLLAIPEATLSIEGHTDSAGSPQGNLRLSQDRAAAVGKFLREMGMPAAAMSATGFGPDRPISPNDTPEGRAKNRRVDIVISKPESARNSGS